MPSGSNSHLGSRGLALPLAPEVPTADNNQPSYGSTQRTVPLFNDSHSNSSTLYSPSPGSPEEQSEHNVHALSDRVSKLEQNLSRVSPGNLDPAWTSFSITDKVSFFGQSPRVAVPELRGSVSKTRLFGHSHWMSSLENVGAIAIDSCFITLNTLC